MWRSLLALLVVTLCVVCTASLTTYPPPTEDAAVQPASALDEGLTRLEQASRFGLATLDALADTVQAWLKPVRKLFVETTENKTVAEVAYEARNATVNFATRVSETQAFQSAQEAFQPLKRMFVRVRDSVKDRTLAQLADDVKQQIDRLDQSVARFIHSFGESSEPIGPVPAEAEDLAEQPPGADGSY